MIYNLLYAPRRAAASTPVRIALLVINPANPNSNQDIPPHDLMVTLGYEPVYLDVNEGQTHDYSEIDVAYVSAGIFSNDGPGYVGIPVPLLVTDYETLESVHLTSAPANHVTEDQLTLSDDTHPITQGLTLGTVTVNTTPRRINYTPSPLPAATTLATVNDGGTEYAAWQVIEAGATLDDGSTLSHPAVLFWGGINWALDPTTEGVDLFERSVNYLAGA